MSKNVARPAIALVLTLALLIAPSAAPKVSRLGFLSPLSVRAEDQVLGLLLRALRERGYEEGQTLAVEFTSSS